jgi:50S ribosomal subunit-associated GTPase HflX
VLNKSDRVAAGGNGQNGEAIWVSALTGEGLDALKAEIASRLPGLAAADAAADAEEAPGSGRKAGKAAVPGEDIEAVEPRAAAALAAVQV